MTLFWILLAIANLGLLGLLRPGNVPPRALLAVLDRILPPVPDDHRRLDRPHRTRRGTRGRHGLGAAQLERSTVNSRRVGLGARPIIGLARRRAEVSKITGAALRPARTDDMKRKTADMRGVQAASGHHPSCRRIEVPSC